MTPQSLARQAYEAYGDAVGWKNHSGHPLPSWELLPEVRKNGWHAAVTAIAAVLP